MSEEKYKSSEKISSDDASQKALREASKSASARHHRSYITHHDRQKYILVIILVSICILIIMAIWSYGAFNSASDIISRSTGKTNIFERAKQDITSVLSDVDKVKKETLISPETTTQSPITTDTLERLENALGQIQNTHITTTTTSTPQISISTSTE
jgi:flagellar basal body-associated protein FliL